MDQNELAAFIEVARLRSFSRAADHLGLAQSVVSKRLNRLEATLGARLIDRNIRTRISLTRAGALFLPEAEAALERLRRAERIGRRLARGSAGPLAIGYVFSAAMTGVLSRLVAAFRSELPELQLDVSHMDTPQQLQALREGRLDLGLARPRRTYGPGLEARSIHVEPLVVAMAPSHPLAAETAVACRQLAGEAIVIPQFHEDVGLIDEIRRIASKGGFGLPDLIRTGDFMTACALGAAGAGLVVGPASLARLSMPDLCFRPFADDDETIALVAVHRADLPDAARALAEACLPTLGRQPAARPHAH